MAGVVLLVAAAVASNFVLFSASESDDVLPSVRYHDYDSPNRRHNTLSNSPEFVKDLYSLQSIPVPGVDYEFLAVPLKLPVDYRNMNSDDGEEKDATVDSAQKISNKDPQVTTNNDASSEADDGTSEQNEETRDSLKQDTPRRPLFDSSDERHDSSRPIFDDDRGRREYESYPSKLPPPLKLRTRLESQYPAASSYPSRRDVEVPRTGFLGVSHGRLEPQPTGSMQGGRRSDERSSKPVLEFHFDIPNDKFHSDLAHGRFSTFKEVPSSLDTLVSSDVSFLNKMIADPPVPDNATRDGTEHSYNTGGGDQANAVVRMFPSIAQHQPSDRTSSSYQTYPPNEHQAPEHQAPELSPVSYEDSRSYSQPNSEPRGYSAERDYPYKAASSTLQVKSKPANRTPRAKRASKTSGHRDTRISSDFIQKNASSTETMVADHGSTLASCADQDTLPFCLVDPSYPTKEIAMALREDVEFKRIFNHLRAAQSSGGRENGTARNVAAHCPSFVRPVRPLKGRDMLGEWKTIVNIDGFGQELLLNTCSAQKSPCRVKPAKSCVQLFEIRMLALYDERTRKLHSGEFRVPTGCICGDDERP